MIQASRQEFQAENQDFKGREGGRQETTVNLKWKSNVLDVSGLSRNSESVVVLNVQ